MEYQNLEDKDTEKTRIITEVIENIAPYVLNGNVTDDNPSPSNNLTGLEQLIIFELGEYVDDQLPLDVIKAKIKMEVWELNEKKEYQRDYKIPNLDDDHVDEIIKKIAKNFLANNITDDNPSPSNGLIAMEQIILYHLEDILLYKEDLEIVILKIRSVISTLEGGANLSSFYRDKNYLNNNFL